MQGTNWLATLNNPDVVPHEYLESYVTQHGAQYCCGQLEKGASGTVHLQFFVSWPKTNKKRPAALKKIDSKVHWEIVKVNNGADDYCLKDDTRVEGPWQFGIKPARRNVKGETKARNEAILKYGPEKAV